MALIIDLLRETISNFFQVGLLTMAMVVFFFLKVDLPKDEEKLSFREEFNWVCRIFLS